MAEREQGNLFGIAAEFDSPEALQHAVHQVTEAGITRAEAYSPFIVAGVAEMLGGRTRDVAFTVLAAGITGALSGFGMCWYANVLSYALNIGGRPYNSWPAWIPITFEMMVLFAALAGATAMIVLNGLPRLNHPVFDIPNFDRASTDRFFLCVEARDIRFDRTAVRSLLASCDPLAISEVWS